MQQREGLFSSAVALICGTCHTLAQYRSSRTTYALKAYTHASSVPLITRAVPLITHHTRSSKYNHIR
eukprot:3523346-Rhodomonas_salina.1